MTAKQLEKHINTVKKYHSALVRMANLFEDEGLDPNIIAGLDRGISGLMDVITFAEIEYL